MNNVLVILFGIITSYNLSAQSLVKTLILKDTKDSTYQNARNSNFDKEGNYCFEIKEGNQRYFFTKQGKIGSFDYIGTTFGSNGGVHYTSSISKQAEYPYYYISEHGTKIYGKAIGKIEARQTSYTRENIALVTLTKKRERYYINDKLVLEGPKDKDKSYISEYNWVAFSENGNVIYYLKEKGSYNLYVNGKRIDQSKFEYSQLAINNKGEYIFAIGKKPKKPIGKYDYMFYIHAADNVLGPVRTVWDVKLLENGAYFYSGDDAGPDYIAINGHLHKNIESVDEITLIDQQNYLYSFVEKGTPKFNVNGTIYKHDYEKTYFPSLDRNGNFSFYGLKDNQLYKFVNGKQLEQPITKHGVSGCPLYISPTGQSLHYFKTDDSIYLYQDDRLIFEPIVADAPFELKGHDDILVGYKPGNSKIKKEHSLFYLQYGQYCYLVFNGQLSTPILPMLKLNYSYNRHKIGAFKASDFNEHGYFLIQRTGKTSFQIIINNKHYEELKGVDKIFVENSFFDGKSLIFYGAEGQSIYQYKLRYTK